jgi:hypothetical protein
LPEGWRERLARSPTSAVAAVFATLLVSLHLTAVYAALHPGFARGRWLWLAVGLAWLALAQVMPRVRRNPLVGIRTAWTLSSDENWARTQAVLGAGVVALVALLVSALAPALYSLVLARRLPPT